LLRSTSALTAYAFGFKGLDGKDIRLGEHAGKPILVVNSASLCGFTPQYAGLQQLWPRYRDRGLVVGMPSNDFGGQVTGEAAHPFYRWAALERLGETPRWNFHKYLIGRNGRVAASFTSEVEPMDARVIAAIEKELPPE